MLRPRRGRRTRMGCPECGGLLLYDRDLKIYTCQNCGRVFTREELYEARRRIAEEIRQMLAQGQVDEREEIAKEYLKWYLSNKKER